jgi:hypothetical protein
MLLPALSLFAVILAQGTERFGEEADEHTPGFGRTAGHERGTLTRFVSAGGQAVGDVQSRRFAACA